MSESDVAPINKSAHEQTAANPMTPPTERGPTTVIYKLKRSDLFKFIIYTTLRNKLVWGIWLILCALLVYTTLADTEATTDTLTKVLTAIILVVFTLLFVNLLLLFTTVIRVVTIRKTGVLCEHVLKLTDDGIVVTSDVNESINRWAGFHKLVATPNYVLLFVTDANAHIVPRRAFASHTASQAFIDEVRACAKAARSQDTDGRTS